jgi:hypothetical protein
MSLIDIVGRISMIFDFSEGKVRIDLSCLLLLIQFLKEYRSPVT